MPFERAEVTINDCPSKSRLVRFCEKKIDQWLQSHGQNASEPIAFKVAFEEEEDSHQVSCVTEIQIGGTVWRGADLATDEQQAFMHSLKRLQHH